jgi:hypothetical protein
MRINNFDPFGNIDDMKSSDVNSGVGIKSLASAPWDDNVSEKSNDKYKDPKQF